MCLDVDASLQASSSKKKAKTTKPAAAKSKAPSSGPEFMMQRVVRFPSSLD